MYNLRTKDPTAKPTLQYIKKRKEQVICPTDKANDWDYYDDFVNATFYISGFVTLSHTIRNVSMIPMTTLPYLY